MSHTADITESYFNYIRFEKRLSPHTLTSYQTDLDQFAAYLKEHYELQDLSLVSYNMIRSWVVFQVEKQYTPRSLNRKIACLRSFYKFLIKKKLVDKDPMLKIKALKTKKSLPVFVEESHMDKLLDQFIYPEGFEGIRDKVMLELLYGTGIRLSELLGLKHSDINHSQLTIKVLGKGNKERIIPINRSLARIIGEYIVVKEREKGNSVSFFIVTDEGEQAYPMFIYRTIRKYLSMITTIEKKSPHVLRHTFATHLLNKGADLNAIKDLLGHSSLAATQVYTHNSLDKIKAIFDQAHPKA